MSGQGRIIADDIEAEQQTRRKGHRTRWQARIEGMDGRTLAKAERIEDEREQAESRALARMSR